MASFHLSDTGVQMEFQEDIFSQHRMKSTCKYSQYWQYSQFVDQAVRFLAKRV
jgi:hypothetical protein